MTFSGIHELVLGTPSEIEENSYTINSLHEYVRLCCEIPRKLGSNVWFRGQSGIYRLLPSLYRKSAVIEDYYHRPVGRDYVDYRQKGVYTYPSVAEMLDSFKQRALPFLKSRPADDFEWMFIMQHHGVPTRFLDWSTDPLTALFFAVNSPSIDTASPDDNAQVWIINPFAINMEIHNSPYPVYLTEKVWRKYLVPSAKKGSMYPICAFANHVNERIVAQSGVFTLYGADMLPLNEIYSLKKHCMSIDFNFEVAKEIRDDLRRIGYTYSRLFPGLDNISMEVKQEEFERFDKWNMSRKLTSELNDEDGVG